MSSNKLLMVVVFFMGMRDSLDIVLSRNRGVNVEWSLHLLHETSSSLLVDLLFNSLNI